MNLSILRSDRRLSRGVILGSAFVLLALALRTGVGFAIGETNADLAIGAGAGIGPALTAHANAGLVTTTVDHADGLIAEAKSALIVSPFDVRAARVIGLTEASRDNLDVADRWLTIAGGMSLRDYLTHAWLADRRFKQANVAAAVREIDITLTQEQASWDYMMPELAKLLNDRRVDEPLASVLARRPYWRGTFLGRAAASMTTPEGLSRVLATLARTPAPPTRDELAAYTANAFGKIDNETLYWQWRALARDDALTAPAMRAGGFEPSTAPVPFSWRLTNGEDLYAEIDQKPSGDGHALLASLSGYVSGGLAAQVVHLAPGDYRWRVDALSEDRESRGDLTWRLVCAPRVAGKVIGEMPVVLQSGSWRTLEARVTVPSDCPVQLLSLDGGGSRLTDPLNIWFDDIGFILLRADPAAPRPNVASLNINVAPSPVPAPAHEMPETPRPAPVPIATPAPANRVLRTVAPTRAAPPPAKPTKAPRDREQTIMSRIAEQRPPSSRPETSPAAAAPRRAATRTPLHLDLPADEATPPPAPAQQPPLVLIGPPADPSDNINRPPGR